MAPLLFCYHLQVGVKPLPKHDRFGRLIPQSNYSFLNEALKQFYGRKYITDLLNSQNLIYEKLLRKKV